jgi:hypothetical protein
MFSLGKYPPIPAESLKELGEWVIGGEYEFSDGDGNWEIGKLLGIVDHEHPYIVLLDARLYPYSRLLIRHIETTSKRSNNRRDSRKVWRKCRIN